MSVTAPARNASRAKWATFLTEQGIDVPDDATRADLEDLWNLNNENNNDTTNQQAVEQMVNNFKAGPNAKLAGQVPADLRFTTKGESKREPETKLIEINGHPAYLYEPSYPTLLLVGARLSSPDTNFLARMQTLVDFVLMSLDTMTESEVRAAVYGRATDFDLNLIGALAAVIFDTWAPDLDTDTSLDDPRKADVPPMNRAQKRASARK